MPYIIDTITAGTIDVNSMSIQSTSVNNLDAGIISATTYLNLPSDIYVTGYTYSNNTFTLQRTTGLPNLSATFNTVTGLTVNGNFSVTGKTNVNGLTANTVNTQSILVNNSSVALQKYFLIGNSSTNTNVDWSQGSLQEINLDNNPTLTFSNAVTGQELSLLLKQQTAGQRTITWPNNVIWNGAVQPVLQNLSYPGEFDTTFNTGTGFDAFGFVNSISIQSDGKIIVGGEFSSYSGQPYSKLIRLLTDGSIDTTFNIGSGINGFVFTTAIYTFGRIIVGGGFSSYDINSVNNIVRLNNDGSFDGAFTIGTGFNNFVRAISVQSDGKIIVGGDFTSYSGNSRNRIIRLNSNGSIDNTFSVGTGFNNSVFSIAVQSDGKILVMGAFSSYNGTSVNGLVRLNSNGSIDNTFNVANGFGYSFSIQSDGKIIAGAGATNITRFNTDGSIDNTFNVGSGFNGGVFTTSIQSDGKIVVGGNFTDFNGNSRNNIVRLNSDGSIDNTFNIGTGISSFIATPVASTAIQSDGKIIAGGSFSSYNGISSNNIVRINTASTPLSYNQVDFEYNGSNYIGSF